MYRKITRWMMPQHPGVSQHSSPTVDTWTRITGVLAKWSTGHRRKASELTLFRLQGDTTLHNHVKCCDIDEETKLPSKCSLRCSDQTSSEKHSPGTGCPGWLWTQRFSKSGSSGLMLVIALFQEEDWTRSLPTNISAIL